MQQKNRFKSRISEENFNLSVFVMHLRHYYGKPGLKAFCTKHDISYNSARKIHQNKIGYSKTRNLIVKAIKSDRKEFSKAPKRVT